MGGHALTPPTDHRLGRPLPHQLANPPQAHPEAHYCFTRQTESTSLCGISPAFAELFPTPGQVTHVLRTRPPLASRKMLVRLACVKHAASVHPEPGSNSPFESYFLASTSGSPSKLSTGSFPITLQLLKCRFPHRQERDSSMVARRCQIRGLYLVPATQRAPGTAHKLGKELRWR